MVWYNCYFAALLCRDWHPGDTQRPKCGVKESDHAGRWGIKRIWDNSSLSFHSSLPGFTQKMPSFLCSNLMVDLLKEFTISNSLLPYHSLFIFSVKERNIKCKKMNSEIKNHWACKAYGFACNRFHPFSYSV